MTSRLALAHLKKADPRFHKATLAHHPTLPPALAKKLSRDGLFARLCRTVISQQLGTGAATSIRLRVILACGGKLTPETVAKVSPATLRKAGLSGAKVKTLKAISKAVKSGSLDLLSLKRIPETEAAEQLMKIWGLGPWSVEMFLMFALGRPDVFSPGDLGLVRAMEAIYALPKNCPRRTLLKISSKWAPYRSWACLLLWRTRDTAPDKPNNAGLDK